MTESEAYDVAVVGGGPSGATAAADLAARGHSVLLLDRSGRIKPCGGAVPPWRPPAGIGHAIVNGWCRQR